MIADAQRHVIVDILRAAVPNLRAVYLYGSRAGDGAYARDDSDFDLAYRADGNCELTPGARFELRNELAGKLRVDLVDLVDLTATDDHILIANILDGDRLWVCPGCLDEAIEWEAKRLTMRNDWWLGERELREAYLRRLESKLL